MDAIPERPSLVATENTTVDPAKTASTDVVLPSQRVRDHMARHKWLYLGGTFALVVLIIILPVVFAYALPREVQQAIDYNAMPLTNPSLAAVSPTEISLGLSTRLHNPKRFRLRLAAFPLELYSPQSNNSTTAAAAAASSSSLSSSSGKTAPFAALTFPDTVLPAGATVPVALPPQVLPVHALQQMAASVRRASAGNATTMEIGLRGATRARVGGGLSYGVDIDKAVDMVALTSLIALKVTAMAATPPARGGSLAALAGNLTLFNPSPLTLDLGDVHHTVSVGGVKLGRTWTKALHIVPGHQIIGYEGELNTSTLIDKANNHTNLKILSNTLDENYRVHFEIVGDRSYIHGEPIKYLDGVVGRISLDAAPCYEAASAALPLGKQEFKFMNFLPDEVTGGKPSNILDKCDASAPLP